MISYRTVINVINGTGKQRESRLNGQEYKCLTPPRKVTSSVLKQLDQMTSNPNPMSQSVMGNMTNLSQSHVSKVIRKSLGKKLKKKLKVHALTDGDRKNRKKNARKLYNKISMDRLEFLVTLDEAMMCLRTNNNKTEHCYLKPEQELPDNCLIESKESFPSKMMVVAGMTGRGVLPLLKIPGNSKVSAENYVKFILKPYFNIYLPALYPQDMNRILFHHDKASSHTANLTTEFLEEQERKHGITFLPKQDIPVKGPDISPLDFFGFGFLKQKQKRCRAKTLKGLWKFWKKTWSEVTPEKCLEVMGSWKLRLGHVYRRDGGHIEHTKKIHKRKLVSQN